MVELKNETKIKQLTLTTTMKILLTSQSKKTSCKDSVVSPANESHAGNNITSYQPNEFSLRIVFGFLSFQLPHWMKGIYLTEYQKKKRCYQGWSLLRGKWIEVI